MRLHEKAKSGTAAKVCHLGTPRDQKSLFHAIINWWSKMTKIGFSGHVLKLILPGLGCQNDKGEKLGLGSGLGW